MRARGWCVGLIPTGILFHRCLPFGTLTRNCNFSLCLDIQSLQWSCHSEDTFLIIFDLLEKKYVQGIYKDQEQPSLKKFFEYFRAQWGPGSHVFRYLLQFFIFELFDYNTCSDGMKELTLGPWATTRELRAQTKLSRRITHLKEDVLLALLWIWWTGW